MADKVTLPMLKQMKTDGRKIAGLVAYDYQMAQIIDRAGVEIVSVGDSVGHNLFGQQGSLEITLEQMIFVCQAVRRGVSRAILNCDFPFGPLQQGTDAAVNAAIRLVKEGGADMVKLDGAADFPEAVEAIVRAGIPVFAQFGITPQTAARYGGWDNATGDLAAEIKDQLVKDAKTLEKVGASILDFTGSGPVAGPEVVKAVDIPVIGGMGGGPWLDGRITVTQGLIGYSFAALDDGRVRLTNVAQAAFGAINTWIDDVRTTN